MTITYSIWQGSNLLSVDNIATDAKEIDHLIDSLNDSDLGKKVKFSACVRKIEVKQMTAAMYAHTCEACGDTGIIIFDEGSTRIDPCKCDQVVG